MIDDTADRIAVDDQILDGGFDDGQVFCLRQFGLHGLAVKLTIDLRPRPAHSRSLRTVKHLELHATKIGHTTHDTVERVDFTYEMTLAQSANRGITGHFASVSLRCVNRSVEAPRRADAVAASQPA